MVRSALRVAFSVSATSILAAAAVAAPVNKAWVAQDAKWLVHVDAEALTESTLGKHVIANRAKLGLEGLTELSALGIDVFKDIKGVTIYDTDDHDDSALVIATTTGAVDMLFDMLKSDPKTKTMTVEGKTIIATDDKGKTQYWHVRPGANAEQRIVMLSDDWKHVAAGIAVVDGASPSLASITKRADNDGKAPSVLLVPAAPGAFVMIRATDVPEQMRKQQDDNASAVLSQVGGVAIDAGENGADAFITASMTADTAENATNIVQFAQGLVALGRIIAGSDEDMKPLVVALAGVSVVAKERDISVSIKHDATKLAEALEILKEHDNDEDDDDKDSDDHKGHEKHEHEKSNKPKAN